MTKLLELATRRAEKVGPVSARVASLVGAKILARMTAGSLSGMLTGGIGADFFHRAHVL